MSRWLLLSLLALALGGCATLAQMADQASRLPWDCGDNPASANAVPSESGGSDNGTSP
jgi:hypothetical protein